MCSLRRRRPACRPNSKKAESEPPLQGYEASAMRVVLVRSLLHLVTDVTQTDADTRSQSLEEAVALAGPSGLDSAFHLIPWPRGSATSN